MHWNQYALPRQQKEWTRIQAEKRAKEVSWSQTEKSLVLPFLGIIVDDL